MKPETRSFYQQAVQRAIDRIVRNLDDAIELETLAKGAGLSPFHFHRVFRGMVGETPVELIRRLRMERAAWSLIHGDRPVTEIAFDAGYETHEAFTRAFRTSYNAPPSAFRGEQSRIELAAVSGVHFDPSGRVPEFVPRDSGGMTMDVEIKSMPELRVFSLRHTGPYNQIPEAFARLGAHADRAGLTFAKLRALVTSAPAGHPGAAMVAVYHDDPESTPADQLRSDAGFVAPEGISLPDGLTEQRLPAGRYACTAHVGPYERLGDAWARFMGEWLPASGRRIGSGPSFEIYRNDPTSTPKAELHTDLYVSIE